MGCETKLKQGFVAKRIPRFQAAMQVGVRIAGISRRELDDDHAQHGAHLCVQRCSGRCLGKEIHVVKTSDPAAQHLGAGQQRAVVNEGWRDMGRFRRPNMIVQPRHQW